jgi:hypothetical protein
MHVRREATEESVSCCCPSTSSLAWPSLPETVTTTTVRPRHLSVVPSRSDQSTRTCIQPHPHLCALSLPRDPLNLDVSTHRRAVNCSFEVVLMPGNIPPGRSAAGIESQHGASAIWPDVSGQIPPVFLRTRFSNSDIITGRGTALLGNRS